ncbi:MAG: hypothetical protein FRX48_03824 [Lasallia pustulata]|uniref:Uncharacterized protein n=1 Tax=Lasallia pustulata TaxID=136370 RepID=A0A5M8PVW7_9LECA|nr:MAG: hypothetical protein FRX48_03824 [Lasallia pustulata]
MGASLPDDILHLICVQLWHQRDFDTLFNCAQAGKQLAAPALANLYRMHEVAPVTIGGSDEVELSRQGRSGDQDFEQPVSRWALLWKSIILSSLGMTLYPYCRYIRSLDLRDLKELLEDSKFRSVISKTFFKGALAQFLVLMDKPIKPGNKGQGSRRLNAVAALNAMGEAVTKETPLLEELSGEILASALSRWIPRIPRLQTMTLWRGAALADGAGGLIRTYCQFFRSLSFYEWSGLDADHKFAMFLNDLRPQSLETFEVISYSDIGAESFLALNCHRESLTELKMNNLKPEVLPALSMLKGCTALTTLVLTDATGTTDLEKTQHDVFLEIIGWLRECKRLESVTFVKFLSAPAILTPLLLENDIHLTKLEVEGYSMKDSRDFHQALAHQRSLERVWLKGDGEEVERDDLDVLVEALSKLHHLKDLRLRDVSDYCRDEHIRQLVRNLPELEEFYTSGYGITDTIWNDVASLKCLRKLDLNAMTSFTLNGILEFISKLGPGNKGLLLAVMMADADSNLTDEEQTLIRETLAAKVEGRFEFTLMRDPEMSEFEGESD